MLKLVKKYVNNNNYFPDSEEFDEYYNSHPDYPSLYAVTDTLSFFKIENLVAKVSPEHLDDLPEHFISIIETEEGDQFVYIKAKDKSVHYLDENFRSVSLTKKEFLTRWKEIILVIDENENPAGHKEIHRNLFQWNIVFFIAFGLVFFLNITAGFYWPPLLFSFFSLSGLYLSILIVRENFGITSKITSKFCGVTQTDKGSCHAVLSSNEAVLYKNFTLSDVCFVFFTAISLLTVYPALPFFFLVIGIISLPVVVYSIWLQKYRVKEWCPFCLAIGGILLSLFILSVYFLSFKPVVFIAKSTLLFIITLMLTASVWMYIKSLLSGYFKLKNSDIQNKKFKRNPKMFNALLNLTKKICYEDLQTLKKIQIGNSEAKIGLDLFLSPSCGYCHKAFEEAYHLYLKFPEQLKLSICFNINAENKNNPYLLVAKTIIQEYISHGDKPALEILIDWHINKITLEDFIKKYKIDISEQADAVIISHFNWCKNNDLNYSPIQIFLQKLMPSEYTIEDLKYFINEISSAQS